MLLWVNVGLHASSCGTGGTARASRTIGEEGEDGIDRNVKASPAEAIVVMVTVAAPVQASASEALLRGQRRCEKDLGLLACC